MFQRVTCTISVKPQPRLLVQGRRVTSRCPVRTHAAKTEPPAEVTALALAAAWLTLPAGRALAEDSVSEAAKSAADAATSAATSTAAAAVDTATSAADKAVDAATSAADKAVDTANAAAAAAAEAGDAIPIPEILLVLSPIILYGIFNVYRDRVNPRAKLSDFFLTLGTIVVVGNILSVIFYKRRFF